MIGNDEQIRTNVRRALERVEAACARVGRDPGAVRILAATKYVEAPTIALLAAAGVAHVAENRLDAIEDKQPSVPDPQPHWHYIGKLQSRKVDAIARRVTTIHTLASLSAARRLASLAEAGLSMPQLFVQVNVADDPAKDGVDPAELDRFLSDLPGPLRVEGLMTMPAFTERPESSRQAFASLRVLAESLRATHDGRHPLTELSMGTSQDFEVAVEEGATHVRLGRILYAVQEYVPG